jgi:hypothetical protein
MFTTEHKEITEFSIFSVVSVRAVVSFRHFR